MRIDPRATAPGPRGQRPVVNTAISTNRNPSATAYATIRSGLAPIRSTAVRGGRCVRGTGSRSGCPLIFTVRRSFGSSGAPSAPSTIVRLSPGTSRNSSSSIHESTAGRLAATGGRPAAREAQRGLDLVDEIEAVYQR